MEHEQPPPRVRRRRGRTTALIAGALVLGALAGTVTGYAIQYDREPTPLPPLAQQKLDTPKAQAPNDATTVKTINANRWHKSDGELTDLLIEAPAGAQVDFDGYDTLDSLSTTFTKPSGAMRAFLRDGFRRLATRSWTQGDIGVEVRLIQFRDFSGADEFYRDQVTYMPNKDFAGNGGVAVPGVSAGLGHVWVYSELSSEGGHAVREARAVLRRGDIVMDVYYTDERARPIAESDVLDLAKRQLERL
ncbi:hypothetical protein AB0469_13225 [Streptomyces sp. NPDC093801]|uniref:hypothetical protein n=1 Tax=Streptomyces sp. NPDC093801 TaxID=3155203 RepID=UPI00344EF097